MGESDNHKLHSSALPFEYICGGPFIFSLDPSLVGICSIVLEGGSCACNVSAMSSCFLEGDPPWILKKYQLRFSQVAFF